MKRKCIMVVGLPRSGTSCVAGALHHSGIYMGPRLTEGDEMNEKGYYECRLIRELGFSYHNLLLVSEFNPERLPPPEGPWPGADLFIRAVKGTVKRFFSIRDVDIHDVEPVAFSLPYFGFKHGTLATFAPLYVQALTQLDIEPYFVWVQRPFTEVGASWKRGGRLAAIADCGMDIDDVISRRAYRIARTLSTEADRTMQVTYKEVLANPVWQVGRIRAFAGIADRFDADAVDEFVDRDLKHV